MDESVTILSGTLPGHLAEKGFTGVGVLCLMAGVVNLFLLRKRMVGSEFFGICVGTVKAPRGSACLASVVHWWNTGWKPVWPRPGWP